VSITFFNRFAIILFVTLLLFGVFFSRIITTSLEENMVNRSKQLTAHFIAENVKHAFKPGEMDAPKLGAEYVRFAGRIRSLTIGNDVDRIKVWNPRMQVTWSDRQELVGLEFADNADLRRAIGGEIVSNMKVPDKAENVFEMNFGRVIELYIPIIRNGAVDSIFEVYLSLDALYEDINAQKRTVWIWTVIGLTAIFSVLSGIVGKASRRIESQTEEISRSEERIRDLINSAKDGIISMNKAGTIVLFNRAAEQMFGYAASEMLGRSPGVLIPPHYRQAYEEGWNLYLRLRAAKIAGKAALFRGQRKDGTLFPLELSLFVSGTANTMIGTAIVRDLSERQSKKS
jgi:PAS domain S-box-containing protein